MNNFWFKQWAFNYITDNVICCWGINTFKYRKTSNKEIGLLYKLYRFCDLLWTEILLCPDVYFNLQERTKWQQAIFFYVNDLFMLINFCVIYLICIMCIVGFFSIEEPADWRVFSEYIRLQKIPNFNIWKIFLKRLHSKMLLNTLRRIYRLFFSTILCQWLSRHCLTSGLLE